MTLKNIEKTGLVGATFLASSALVCSNDVSAQNIGDSTKVTKTIGLEFLIYDENTNLPIEGAGSFLPLKAQNNPSQVMDSVVVSKQNFLIYIYDEVTVRIVVFFAKHLNITNNLVYINQ